MLKVVDSENGMEIYWKLLTGVKVQEQIIKKDMDRG